MATNHYVYMLECKDGTLYTGYTVDLEERIKMHEAGKLPNTPAAAARSASYI